MLAPQTLFLTAAAHPSRLVPGFRQALWFGGVNMIARLHSVRHLLMAALLVVAMLPAGATSVGAAVVPPACPGAGGIRDFPVGVIVPGGTTLTLAHLRVNETACTFQLVAGGQVIAQGTFTEFNFGAQCLTEIDWSGHFIGLPSLTITGGVLVNVCTNSGVATTIIPGVGTITVGFINVGGTFVPISLTFSPAFSLPPPGDD